MDGRDHSDGSGINKVAGIGDLHVQEVLRAAQEELRQLVRQRASALPRFSLGRNSVVHAFETVTYRLVGKPSATVALGSSQDPEFSAHYWITGADRAAMKEFLSASRVRFIENAKLPGIMATNANYLVYFEGGVLGEENDFDSFIARVETIAANML